MRAQHARSAVGRMISALKHVPRESGRIEMSPPGKTFLAAGRGAESTHVGALA